MLETTPKTKVVNVKSGAPFDVYIGRAMPGYAQSPYHNPIKLVPGMTRQECLERLRRVWADNPELIERMKKELTGKTIACWCEPQLCHGHLIVELIEGISVEQQFVKKTKPQLTLFD